MRAVAVAATQMACSWDLEENLEAASRQRKLSTEEDKAIREKSKRANAEIHRAMDVGAFYLCEDAIERLRRFRKESAQAGKDGSWIEYLLDDLKAANSCVKDMMEIARRDLRVK